MRLYRLYISIDVPRKTLQAYILYTVKSGEPQPLRQLISSQIFCLEDDMDTGI